MKNPRPPRFVPRNALDVRLARPDRCLMGVEPVRPSAERPWTRRLAAHLYRRAGFSASLEELDEAVRIGPAAAIEKLMRPPADERYDEEIRSLARSSLAGGNPQGPGAVVALPDADGARIRLRKDHALLARPFRDERGEGDRSEA